MPINVTQGSVGGIMSGPKRRRVSSPAPSYGGYSPYSGGGGPAPKPSKPKPPPTLAQYLNSDADYQDQMRAFQRALSDFGADVKRRTGKVTADYDKGAKQMGEQRVKDLSDIMNDFAARGLLKSGLYGQRESEYEKTYQNNLTELGNNRKSLLDDISTEQKNYQRQQELQKETAKKEAARRRAEKYGI